VVFASTLFTRAVDPVVPKIAHDLGIDVKTAALLSTAFTFPYAFVQPVLGTIGDFFGKTRLMNLCLAVVVTTTLVCAFADSFSLLVAMRVIAGMLAGGIYPVGVAMVGDLVPVHERQVAIGRLLAVALTGNLIGATVSGFIGDLLGWRGVFFSIGAFGLAVAVIAFFAFRGLRTAKPRPFNLAAVTAGFRSVFSDPRTKFCFGSVFFEGIVIHGLFPYVALLLLAVQAAREAARRLADDHCLADMQVDERVLLDGQGADCPPDSAGHIVQPTVRRDGWQQGRIGCDVGCGIGSGGARLGGEGGIGPGEEPGPYRGPLIGARRAHRRLRGDLPHQRIVGLIPASEAIEEIVEGWAERAEIGRECLGVRLWRA